jgi:enoyl-CoA hydratase/carnithine racemase
LNAAHATDSSTFETLIYRVDDHVATMTLNRPEVHNALNRRAYSELESAFARVASDEQVRCVVITGAGRSFCSGDDVREIMAGEDKSDTVRRLATRPRPTPAAVRVLTCDRPVIAAVNGAAVGWGMELALFADIRIASGEARFGELFVKRGLVSDIGGLMRLPAVVGPSKAAELLFTGDLIGAEEALRIGLVSQVVSGDSLMPAALELAGKISRNPPLAVRALKEGLRRASHGDVDELGTWVSRTLATLFQTQDHREGVAAFLEKRPADFRGL